MKIKVTQEHIDNGVPGECWACPIALALKDAGFPYIGLGYCGDYCFTDSYGNFTKTAPKEVNDFANAFDSGKAFIADCKPFEFEFDI